MPTLSGASPRKRNRPDKRGAAQGGNPESETLVSDLIDTTEMYLKTVYELEEDGVLPLRARIVERLDHSGPTVSQTVGRMERDGLIVVAPDRSLQLTDAGRRIATEVIRKHRLAERLLQDVIGLDRRLIHDEACRWEHVMSEQVEARLETLLGEVSSDPFGNRIPELEEGRPAPAAEEVCALEVAAEARNSASAGAAGSGGDAGASVTAASGPDASQLGVGKASETDEWEVARVGEPIQAKPELIAAVENAGIRPGARVQVRKAEVGRGIRVGSSERDMLDLAEDEARHLFLVRRR